MVEASNIPENTRIPDAGEKPALLPLAVAAPTAAPIKTPVIKTPGPGPMKPPSPGGPGVSDRLLAELDALIGLDGVKAQVRRTVNVVKLGRAQERAGLKRIEMTHHLVFTGNPGTGKTTVARIVGRIYKEIGLLKSGHLIEAQRSDLVGEYQGWTEKKTQGVIDTALDGVLFIDEAYSLVPNERPNDFGQEVIATLITAMENQRNRLVVIAAGYKDEMARFIASNPGLKSRFKNFIEFEDYSSAELFRILTYMASEAGIRFSSDAMIAAAALMESLETGTKGFGNGRTVRNIFEECLARMAGRLADGRERVDVTMFERDDIPRPGEMVLS